MIPLSAHLTRRNIVRLLAWATGGLLALWLLLWLLVPPVLQSQIQTRASQALGRQVQVGAVRFAPWSLELWLDDLDIATADGKGSQLHITQIYANAELASVWSLAPVLDALVVDSPSATLQLLQPGHYDIDDILHTLTQRPASDPAAFALYNVEVRNGSVLLDDRHTGQQHSVQALLLRIPFISNLGAQRDIATHPRLAFTLNGSPFDSDAQATPFASRRAGQARLNLQHIQVADYLRYLPTGLPVHPLKGEVGVDVTLDFAQDTHSTLKVQGTLQAQALVIRNDHGQTDTLDLQQQFHGEWNGQQLALQLDNRLKFAHAPEARLQFEGHIAPTPLQVQGRLLVQQLPLHTLLPYLGRQLPVTVRAAEASFAGDVQLQNQAQGLHIEVKGDAGLGPLQVYSQGQRPEELLRWKLLQVKGLDLHVQPNAPLALQSDSTTLSDFFARVVLQESGRLNLQDLLVASADKAAAPAQPTPPSTPPQIQMGPIRLEGGTVFFQDQFIQPNYSTDLTQLHGQLSGIATSVGRGGKPQLADLSLRGIAEGSAVLSVSGKLNPLANPLVLDVRARMRGLELPPLSAYATKYAGYGIQQGQLSMDVRYQVQPDGQLTASNRLVLNKLTFGEKVEGAPANLPVKLIVALLSDDQGVIDLDLPISGSLNDPEFSLGPIIARVFGKAFGGTGQAPFQALTGDPDSGTIVFAPGSSVLDTQARASLDKTAAALRGKPTLALTISGTADRKSVV